MIVDRKNVQTLFYEGSSKVPTQVYQFFYHNQYSSLAFTMTYHAESTEHMITCTLTFATDDTAVM